MLNISLLVTLAELVWFYVRVAAAGLQLSTLALLSVVCKTDIHHGDRKSAPVNQLVLLEANPLVGFATILGALRKAVV